MSIDALFRQLSAFQTEFVSRNQNLDRRSEMQRHSLEMKVELIRDNAMQEEIACRRARGEKFRVIAAALNAKGFVGKHGGRWYEVSVRNYCRKQGL
jgi:hypothetical protein